MKKFVAAVITLLMMVSMAACQTQTTPKSVKVEDVKSKTGLMLSTEYVPEGIVRDEEYLSKITYELYYNGQLEMTATYSQSGDYKATVTVSDDELLRIYTSCLKGMEKAGQEEIGNVMIDGFEGGLWTFTYYESGATSGTVIANGGFASGSVILDTFRNTLLNYSNEAELTNANGEAAPEL